ncbi:MAG: hypothetical protein V3V20_05095 [Algisphaera sp.]
MLTFFHQLDRDLGRVGRRARRMLITQRVCVAVVVFVGALCLLGVLDYWLRFPGVVRLGVGLALFALAIWRGVPSMRRAWGFHPSRDALAARLESRVPALRGQLASTLEFGLEPQRFSPPVAEPVTAALAAAAVEQTQNHHAAADLNRQVAGLINPKPTRIWLALGLGALGLAVAVGIAAPTLSATGWWRWFAPLGTATWPARTALVAPNLPPVLPVDTPADLRATVERGHRSGLRVWAHHRFVQGPTADVTGAQLMTEQSEKATYRLSWRLPPEVVRAVTTGEEESVDMDHWFTARDGRTQVQRVTWVARPRIIEMEAHTQPPAYAAGLVLPQKINLDRTGGTLSVRGGSHVELRLTFNKNLNDDALSLPGFEGIAFETSHPNALTTVVSWDVNDDLATLLELTDQHGLSAVPVPRFVLNVEPDTAPRVTWVAPMADLAVLATAQVPVTAEAVDDVAVAWLKVTAALSDDSEQNSETQTLAQETVPRATITATAALDLKTVTFNGRGVAAGDVIMLRAIAQDVYKNKGESRSETQAVVRRLTVIEPAVLVEQLQADLAAVRRQAMRLERDQKGLAQRDDNTPPPAQQASEQERLNARLVSPAAQLSAVAERMQLNRLADPSLSALVKDAQKHVAAAAASADRAAETLREAATESNAEKSASQNAQAAQDQAASQKELTQLTALLDQGRDALGLKLELARLRTEQDRLAQDTRQLLPRTIGRDAASLDAETRAKLDALAKRQKTLAAQADEAIRGLQATAESLMDRADAQSEASASGPSKDPANGQPKGKPEDAASGDRARAAAQALAEAAAVAQRQGLSEGQRKSAQALGENRLSEAGLGQSEAMDTLDAMMKQLGEEESIRQAMLKRRVLQLIEKLRRLVADQTQTLAQLEDPADLELLAAGQSALWVRTVEAETLATTAAEAGEEDLNAAAQHLVQAAEGQSLAQAAIRANEIANAQGAERSALEALEHALAAAQAAQKKTAGNKTQQERAKLREAYAQLAQRQEALQEEVTTAVGKHADDPQAPLPRRVRAVLRGLAAKQATLREDASDLALEVDETLVFKQTHTRIDISAQAAAQGLRAQAPQPDNIADDQSRVAMLLRAMAAALKSPKKDHDFASGGGGGGGGEKPPALVPSLAELRLLRSMQQAVYDATRTQNERAGGPHLTRLDRLGAEQRELADLSRQLIQKLKSDPQAQEDTP